MKRTSDRPSVSDGLLMLAVWIAIVVLGVLFWMAVWRWVSAG